MKFRGLAVVAALALGVAVSCSDSSRKRYASTTASSTTTSSTNTTTATSSASITSLRVAGTPLVSGNVALAYRITDATAKATDVEVRFSVDGGQTWGSTSAVSSSAGTSSLTTGPAPGIEHTYLWDSASDIAGFEPNVLLEVRPKGGLGLSVALAVDNQPVSTHVSLNRWPFLQSTDRTSTVIQWRTETATDSVVEWGPTPLLGNTAGAPGGATTKDHLVRLTGLQAGTAYYYRILAGGKAITPRHVFESAPVASSTDFSFVVVGDSGMNNPEQYAIANLMAQENADFFLHTGDIVYPIGGLGAVVNEYNARFFKPYQAMLHRIPSFPVVGNHDLYGLYGQPYRDTFTMPPNGNGSLTEELYFSFEWGDAKFIALDTNSLFQFIPIGAHMTWLNNQLASNTKKWTIVYMHAPLYSAGKHGDNRLLQTFIGGILERNRVDLVLAGHDHNYERTKPIKKYNTAASYPGLVHVITGGGGAGLRPVNPTPNTDVAISAHHYLKVQIQGDYLHGTAVDINGQVIDQFSVRDQ